MATVFEEVYGVATVCRGLASEWAQSTSVIPPGVVCFERDTLKFKVGNGSDTFTNLTYVVDEILSVSHKTILEKVNTPGGVLTNDSSGRISMEFIPAGLQTEMRVVADIAARDALKTEGIQNGKYVIVVDASGDPTVNSGSATYVYQGPEYGGNDWVKVSEAEVLDLDFTDFVKDGDSADRLIEGTLHKFLTLAERNKIALMLLQTSPLLFTEVTPDDFTGDYDAGNAFSEATMIIKGGNATSVNAVAIGGLGATA